MTRGCKRLRAVPQKLYMTVPDANKRLSGRATMARLPFHRLSGFDKLAFFLAFERRRGERSFWYPYIAALPDDNPCAWALTDSELESTIAAFDPKVRCLLYSTFATCLYS